MIVIFTHDVLIYLLMLSISLISYDTAQKASPEIPFRSYRRTLCPLRECNPSNMAIVVRPLQQSADDQSGGGLIGQRVGEALTRETGLGQHRKSRRIRCVYAKEPRIAEPVTQDLPTAIRAKRWM